MSDSWISPEARLGKDVRTGWGVVVHPGVTVGEGSRIGDHCVLGLPPAEGRAEPLEIGPGSVIRSHNVLYGGSRFGPGLEVGHHALLRHGIVAGANLRVGSYSDIEPEAAIGDYCRFHGYVHVGRGSRIGHFVWLYSLVTLTNDPLPPSHLTRPPVLEDGVVVCVGATVMPGALLRKGAFVAAGSVADGEIPAGAVVRGNPGTVASHVSLLVHPESGLRHPWTEHFADAYPAEARERIARLGAEIAASRRVLKL